MRPAHDKTSVARLLRVLASVARAVMRVVPDHLDEARLDGLYGSGSTRSPGARDAATSRWWPTTTATASWVWAGKGRSAATAARFFTELGPERTAALQAVSCDMSAGYLKAVAAHAHEARVAIDPFHEEDDTVA